MVDIRAAVATDAEAIARVHVRSWQAAYQGLMPQAHLDGLNVDHRQQVWRAILAETGWPRAGALVADAGDGVVGFAHVCPTRDDDRDPTSVGEVTSIYVLSDAWRAGVGRALLAAGVASLAEAGFAEATLWVLDTNDRARRFYAASGWRPDGAVKDDDLRGFPLTEVRYHRRWDP